MTFRCNRTSRITVGDVLDEFASILLFQADQLTATASLAIAEGFIGFERGDGERSFGDLPTSRVDLRRFPMFRTFYDAVEFVTHPHPDHVMGEEVLDLRTFLFHAPRSGPHSAVSRKQRRFMHPRGLCRTVADAAIARWKLEIERRGEFSVRELALLADVTDAAALGSLARWRANNVPGASFPAYMTLPIEDAVL